MHNKKLYFLKIHKYFFYISHMSKYIIKQFNIFYHQNDLNHSRLGWIIKKQHINYSNKRNLIKRIIIDNFIHKISYLTKFDIIITTNQCLYFKQIRIKEIINKIFFIITNFL